MALESARELSELDRPRERFSRRLEDRRRQTSIGQGAGGLDGTAAGKIARIFGGGR